MMRWHKKKRERRRKEFVFAKNGISINTLLRLHGGSVADFYREYGIPRRTMQNWLTETNNHSDPPQYLMRLILADLI